MNENTKTIKKLAVVAIILTLIALIIIDSTTTTQNVFGGAQFDGSTIDMNGSELRNGSGNLNNSYFGEIFVNQISKNDTSTDDKIYINSTGFVFNGFSLNSFDGYFYQSSTGSPNVFSRLGGSYPSYTTSVINIPDFEAFPDGIIYWGNSENTGDIVYTESYNTTLETEAGQYSYGSGISRLHAKTLSGNSTNINSEGDIIGLYQNDILLISVQDGNIFINSLPGNGNYICISGDNKIYKGTTCP